MISRRRFVAGAALAVASMWRGRVWAASPATRVCFGSCLDQRRDLTILQTIAARAPQAMVFMGDNVYGDVAADDPQGVALQQAYERLAAQPDFQALRAQVPLLATWDDHDYGQNDAGSEWAFKDRAKALFADFWQQPVHADGVYGSRLFGPPAQQVQVIWLDCRYNRSALRPTDARGAPGRERYLPDDNPALTMLGDRQWSWLAEQLRHPAAVRVVVSSIQVLADGHGWECWANLPRQRERLIDLLRAASGRCVLLSGDRHMGGIYGNQGLVEITSSSLNKPLFRNLSEVSQTRLTPLVAQANFGELNIHWPARQITLSLHGKNEAAVVGHQIRF